MRIPTLNKITEHSLYCVLLAMKNMYKVLNSKADTKDVASTLFEGNMKNLERQRVKTVKAENQENCHNLIRNVYFDFMGAE